MGDFVPLVAFQGARGPVPAPRGPAHPVERGLEGRPGCGVGRGWGAEWGVVGGRVPQVGAWWVAGARALRRRIAVGPGGFASGLHGIASAMGDPSR